MDNICIVGWLVEHMAGIVAILTFLALLTNTLALWFVVCQTSLTRKAVDLSRESIDNDRKVRQMELLPEANFVIHVQVKFRLWIEEIDGIGQELSAAIKTGDANRIREVSAKARKELSGLVHKWQYEHGPKWLGEIYVAGAQYYHEFQLVLGNDGQPHNNDFWLDVAPDILGSCEESSYHLKQLREYIDWVVPSSFAHCPDTVTKADLLRA